MVRGADDVGDRGGEKKRIWGNDAAPSAGGCVGAGYRRLGCKALRSCAAALPAARRILLTHGVRPPDVRFAANLGEALIAARESIKAGIAGALAAAVEPA